MTALANTGRGASLAFAALVLAIATFSCSAVSPASETFASHNAAPEHETGDAVVVAAGDIASCESEGDEATADLLARTDGTVLTLGDNVYDDGTLEEFTDCYGPSWGRYKHRTKPSPGNHDYNSEGAERYFDYFSREAIGDPDEGYYSYDLGAWHLVVLNSNCVEVGGCDASSPQVRWLETDLAENAEERCTLAYWHHPLFSSGEERGSTPEVKPLWEALYKAGADVVLSGHEHNYERFAPQDPNRRMDLERGIREFVVGTGGKSHYEIETTLPNSEIHNDKTYGVLKLNFHPKSYDWRFVPVEGETFTDSGHDRCH